MPPLHRAVMSGDTAIALHLIHSGASLTSLDEDGNMAVSYCTNSIMFDVLVSSAARGHTLICWDVRDSSGKTIVYYAALLSRCMHTITHILQHVGDANLLDSLGGVDNKGDTFMQTAAKVGNIHVLGALELLLQQRQSNIIVYAGHMHLLRTLFSDTISFAHALLNGHTSFLDAWLKLASIAGVTFSVTLESTGNPFSVTLDFIINTGIPPETIDAIRKEIDGEDVIGHMPLYILLYAGRFQAVHLLLHYAQRFNLQVMARDGKHQRTYLHWAVLHRRKDIIQALFHYGNSQLERKQDMVLSPISKDLQYLHFQGGDF